MKRALKKEFKSSAKGAQRIKSCSIKSGSRDKERFYNGIIFNSGPERLIGSSGGGSGKKRDQHVKRGKGMG